MDSFLKKECDLEFFHTNGYTRKQCPSCKAYYWTLNASSTHCGDQPCVPFSFIGNPLGKQRLSLNDVREHFLSFFEDHNHSRLRYPETGPRCPVIARWRSDIYLTIASIADFQPHVTSGVVPPPANPLVISQPCIRLNDLEEIGRSGRHLSMFEMLGHHAFNKNTDEVYWKEDTVQYCDEFFATRIKIPRELINYKEQLWDGGGNAGPCLEVLARGLEIATLVFMNMKEDDKGTITINNKQYSQNPLNIVDTGYGLERISWVTTGTPTVYETVFPTVVEWIRKRTKSSDDLQSIYSLADHSKCLAFMLGDGIVPSNVKAGYLARLMIRRSLRFLEKLDLRISLSELVDIQLDLLKCDFPSLAKRKSQINEILNIETQRFSDTLAKGENLIKRTLKDKGTIDTPALIYLYDTHGMPPDVVQRIAKTDGISVVIPKNFDSMIAELHSHEKPEDTGDVSECDLPKTERLYYQNHYTKEFTATVLWAQRSAEGMKVILDKTAFYPEGGGQPGDLGELTSKKKQFTVKKVEKCGESIVHHIDGALEIGDTVHGKLDWDHRYTLMKHHTGTHVVNGALRTLFGEHIWQAGSQLGVNEARFDFAHYKSISESERKEIERLGNELITKGAPVEKKVMERNDAERAYGFRLYQGGVPPGNSIRVIHIPGVDVEACGGTHLNNINEIEKIRIVKTERIQDGVNRVTFAAGKMADVFSGKETDLFQHIMKTLSSLYTIKLQENISEQLQDAAKIFSVTIDQLDDTIQRFLKETKVKKERVIVHDLPDACQSLFEEWKQIQKKKKQVSFDDLDRLRSQGELVKGTRVRVLTVVVASESTATAGAIVEVPDFVVHVYDGNKITSAASENVQIDLREIAPEIGRILGGSGGGKSKMTQSGGPKKDCVPQALEIAKKLTIDALNRKKV
ncbi:MAG: alanine--tRNA ligase [Methanobacteriota archaeon]